MNVNSHHTSNRRRSGLRVLGVMLAVIFVGPIIGLSLAVYGLVLAPPWVSLTGTVYVLLACLGLPIGVVAALARWIRVRELILALIVAGMAAVFYLALIGPWVPGETINCQGVEVPAPRARYACVSTSSDTPSHRYEFVLEGRAGWPAMRMVHSRP